MLANMALAADGGDRCWDSTARSEPITKTRARPVPSTSKTARAEFGVFCKVFKIGKAGLYRHGNSSAGQVIRCYYYLLIGI
jgi:hypothetical protein